MPMWTDPISEPYCLPFFTGRCRNWWTKDTYTSPNHHFLKLVKDLKSAGSSIVYVSHRLMDVLEISDRVIVLRTGKKIAEKKKKETSLDEIVYLMMGKRKEENG